MPGAHDLGAFTNQLLVPVSQLLALCLSLIDAPQQVVALQQDAIIALQRTHVEAIRLRNRDVEITAPSDRRAGDQLDVGGGEQHGGELADHL